MKHHDNIGHRTHVIIRHTGARGRVIAVDNNPYVRLLKVRLDGGNAEPEWYRPSLLMRADDPERPGRGLG